MAKKKAKKMPKKPPMKGYVHTEVGYKFGDNGGFYMEAKPPMKGY